MKLVLRQLNEQDEIAFFDGLKLFEGEELFWYTFSWKPGMAYQELLQILKKEHLGQDLGPGRVPHTMLYAFVDGKIVGRLSVRHELNEKLRYRGGHVGYAVAPIHRKKGYATEIMKQGIEFCKNLGLKAIMITCADDNEASWKVIEKFGGVLRDRVWDDEDSETIRRYDLTISPIT